jgi:SAM-dependent methyltransferase
MKNPQIKNPMILLENIRDFMKSRIILTASELDLFTQIHRGIDTARELAEKIQLDLRAVTRLLDAVVTFELLTKKNEHYVLTDEGVFLSSDHPETPLPMVLHMNELWDTWSRLTDIVIQGRNPDKTPITEREEKTVKAFIGAMHVVGMKLSRQIAQELDLSQYSKLLDIGGASGTYTIAFLEKNPGMKAVLFDLKQVIPMAEERLRKTGMLERVKLVTGNFEIDPLPRGCDLAMLSAIIHQNSPDQNQKLYGNIHQALLPCGMLIIRDHIMDDDRVNPHGGAIFAINMLTGTQGGDTYTFSEVAYALETAGFIDVKQIKHGERMDCIVTARKPA